MALEPEFWAVLATLAGAQARSLGALVAEIDARRTDTMPDRSLASALRVFALENPR